MRRRSLLLSLASVLTAGARSAVAQPDETVADFVRRADQYRSGLASGRRLEQKITDWGRAGPRTYRYATILGGAAGALVLALDGDQKGQRFLSTPTGFWLYAPRTRRAIRLTPMQTLRGQASVGDLASLSFSQDYEASWAQPRTATMDGRACLVVDLRTRSSKATYAAITLYIEENSAAPVQAHLHAISGRLLKIAQFDPPDSRLGRKAVLGVTYIDAVNRNRRTKVEVISESPVAVKPQMFRPETLGQIL